MLTATNTLTEDIEAVQAKINTARVQAGSQYAALESAVSFTTDLTAQYELGFNTVNDVNFSMETAHLAKNQILQQAATAMLAQANVGQQSLPQLIQSHDWLNRDINIKLSQQTQDGQRPSFFKNNQILLYI